MIMLSFKTKRDKEKMLEKARKMEEYVAEIVDCLEDAVEGSSDEWDERSYRQDAMQGRYSYRNRMR